MRHEPNDSLPPLQPIADQRCPSCRAVRPLEDFLNVVGTRAGCCVPCRYRQAAIARRQQRVVRQVAGRAEASYRTLLAEHREGGGNAA